MEFNHIDYGPLINDIYSGICGLLGKKREDVCKKNRRHEFVKIRQIAMVAINEVFYGKVKVADIAFIVGQLHHSSVCHSKKVVSDLCDTDVQFKYEYEECLLYVKNKFDEFEKAMTVEPLTLEALLRECMELDPPLMVNELKKMFESYDFNINIEVFKKNNYAKQA